MSRLKGFKVTEETREKIRRYHLGRPKPWLLGKSAGMLGKHHSVGSRRKIGLAGLGRIKTAETRRKLSLAGMGRILSLETRKKVGDSYRGEKSVNWKGGIEPENKRIRKSIEYRLWREAVFARDNYTDQKTGVRGGKLHPHHIQNFAQYPGLRFAIDNGITLSEKSHKEFHHKYGNRNNTREQLEEFLNK